MTTLEKLFVQIFDRKDWIIDQVQQQADSYTQQLASRLVIDGITPPPWLLSPNSSNPNGLEKEEIISKLLLRPQDSTRYSIGGRSLCYPPIVAGGNINRRLSTETFMETHAPNKAINLSNEHMVTLERHNNGIVGSLDHVPELDDSAKSPQSEMDINRRLSTEPFMEAHAPNKAINLSNEHMVTLERHNNDIVGSLDHVPELDNSAKSPQSEMDARITGVYAAPDMSLARIQRSKSRQKARELRTNGKSTAKSCSNNENRTCISFTGDSKSRKDFHQVTQDKCPSDMSKWNNISGTISMEKEGNGEKGNDQTSHSCRLAKPDSSYEIPSLENENNKIRSSFDKEELDGGIMVQPTCDSLQQSCHVNVDMEGVYLPDVCLGSYASKKSITGKTQGTQSENNLCGRITGSRTSSQQTTGINKPSKLGTSVSCHPEDGGALSHSIGDLMHKLNSSNTLSDAAETSQVLSDINAETQAICSTEGVLKPVISSYTNMKESPLGAHDQENAEIVVENGPINEPVAMQPVNPGIKLVPVTLSMESEGLALRQSSDCCVNVKPKHLNFDEVDEHDSGEIISSLSKKRKLDGLLGKECKPSKGSASSIDHKSSCNLFEQQLSEVNIVSSGLETARVHNYNNIDEFAKDEMKNIGLDMNENPVGEDVEHKSSSHDIDLTCEVNLSPKEVINKFDKELHSENNLNKDQTSLLNMQTKEDDLDHKGKESAAALDIAASNIKSSSTSSLTKQGNNGFEDCLDKEVNKPEVDLDFSKSKEFDVGTNAKLSNMKLNSAKVNTWPLNQQKSFEDHLNCLSDSRNFRVHIQRDAVHCDLENPENVLNLSKESVSILSSEKIHLIQSDGDMMYQDERNCDFSEGTESLLEIQAAQEIVTEVDDATAEITDTLKQAEQTCVLNLNKDAADDSAYRMVAEVGPANSIINGDVVVTDKNNIEINLPEWVSSYGSLQSSLNDDNTVVVSDEITPVNEGFIIDDETRNVNLGNNGNEIDFGTLDFPSTTVERAGIIEQICKSASMQTPLSQFSSSFKQHQVLGLYGSMADGILDHMDLGTTVSTDEDFRKSLQTSDSGITKIDPIFPQQQKFDYATPLYWQSKNYYSSPVGKLWERSASSSGSSEIQLSSNPDLTCFPIEEDPSSNEENENPEEMHDELQENASPDVENENPVMVSMEMKVARRENDDEVEVEVQEPPVESTEVCTQHGNHVSVSSMNPDRYSSNSVSIEVSIPRTRDKVKYKPKLPHGLKVSRYEEDNRNLSIATRASSRGNLSVNSESKSSTRSGIPRLSQKEAKRNNIVSNVASFVPMVKQKQAAAVCTGKRDIKVKALEAAEAAKRREQEKENERKLKKDALKLERARIEKEKVKEMELNLKKQKLKKKEADIAARKRQREEEERKQLAKKRKLVAEAQKNQNLKHEKSRVGKLESEKHVKNAAMAGNKKNSENPRQNKNADESSFQKHDTEVRIDKILASAAQQVTSVSVNHDASNDCGEKVKKTSINEMSPVKVVPVKLTSQENSYDISPYQCSDDEDDKEDDLPTKKFVPSWASKNRVAMVLPLQQKLDPESIFPVDSFCSMDEVLLPLRLQAQ